MEIQHFSHEHPLTLKEEEEEEEEEEHKHASDSGDGVIKTCKGCLEPIILSSSSSFPRAYYSCAECKFFLHKLCAQLPLEIDHHTHPQHKLKLQVLRSGSCDVCECQRDDAFTYGCRECNFDIDIICVTLMERKIDHESHIHPLIRLRAPQLSNCYACGTEHKGIFYHCPTCFLFLIHEDCFSLPTTIKHSDHDDDDHPLILAYSLPSEYRTFWNYCDICTKDVEPQYWVYYCAICRFFAHVNCATSKIEPFQSIFLPRRMSKVITEQVEDSGVDVFRFPVVDQSITLISYILTGTNVTEDGTVNQVLNHFSHDHPLILNVQDTDSDQSCLESKLCLLNDTRVEETICNACVRPIFATPFYRCANQCNFFLHKCCAELPTKIDQHPYHPEHPLILLPKSPTFFNLFLCKGCDLFCNGFSYNCSSCNFYLDVQCGSLPKAIKHEAHHPNHILSLRRKLSNRCNACYWDEDEPILAYRCNNCDFEIDSCCALLAHKVRHRYDDHPFILSYSPVKNHSVEYYCELCEGALDPKRWFYHCVDCDKSIHVKCLRSFYSWTNIKYGCSSTLNIESHQHPLALSPVIHEDTKINNSLRVIIRDAFCDNCGRWLYTSSTYSSSPEGCFGFRCVQCNFKLCYKCAKCHGGHEVN